MLAQDTDQITYGINGMIREFQRAYSWLSNFILVYVIYEDVAYRSVEVAYQAARCADINQRRFFEGVNSGQAKRLGRNITIRKDWDKVKDQVMFDLLTQKFNRLPFQKLLRETENQEIIEGNYWHDNYWGNCTCNKCEFIKGQNKLGKMIMQIRG